VAGGPLAGRIENALKQLEAGKEKTACNTLASAAAHVRAQRGKGFTDAEADDLLARIDRARATVGC
jgi:hypothetical protein